MQNAFNFESYPTIAQALRVEQGQDPKQIRGLRLIFAIHHHDARLAYALAEADADVNVRDEDMMTPVHHVAALGERRCARVIFATGRCDFLVRDNAGRLPSDLAFVYARDYALARLLNTKRVQQAARIGIAL